MPLHVLEGNGPSLMGRNWLHSIKLNWSSINKMSSKLDEVLSEHKEVFQDQIRDGYLPVSRGVSLGERVSNNTDASAVTWGIESGDEANSFVGIERNNVADEAIEQQT